LEAIGGIFGFFVLLGVLGAVSAGATFALHHLIDGMPKKSSWSPRR
jgi:hypothetical protein